MTSEHVKIGFPLNPDDWHGTAVETLWAKPIGGARAASAFELDNTPFFAKGVSYRDVIRAVEREGLHEFAGVIEHSGHSTYRIRFEKETATVLDLWSKLETIGCTREWGDCNGMILYAIDVPPATNVEAVCAILEGGEAAGIWEFDEGRASRPLSDKNDTPH